MQRNRLCFGYQLRYAVNFCTAKQKRSLRLSQDGYNAGCPKELQLVQGDAMAGQVIGCKSACEAFLLDQYCCKGEFQQSLKGHAQRLIATALMMEQAHLPARLLNFPSHSVPVKTGKLFPYI